MNWSVYKHLLKTYGRRSGVWIGILTGLMRPLLLMVLTAILMAQVAANIAVGDTESAQRNIIYLLLVNLAGVVVTALGELAAQRSENAEYSNRLMAYYQKLVGKDMSFYRDHQTGYLTSTFRQYLDSAMHLLRLLRVDIARTLVAFVAPVVVLAVVDWRLGLAAFGVIMVQLLYVVWASARSNKWRKLSHELYRKVVGEVADTITNIVAFKSSGAGKEGRKRMARLAQEEIHAFWQRRKVGVLLDLPRGLITSFGVAIVFWTALASGASGAETVGTIVLVGSYLFTIIRNVNELPSVLTNHDDLVTKLYPTLEYLSDQHKTIRDPAKPRKLHVSSGAIDIKQVGFSYPSHSGAGKDITVFENLNLEISGGERIGIVGLSGAGKSTLASLLMRFDDVSGGAIKIDGVDIRTVKQNDLHRAIAYVPQEPLLFHRTIRDNIAYFCPNATNAQIQKAARAAHAHEFITRLPEGYDTVVGERGVKLSGGQKQRVVIARSILKNAPIMLFDEATSALDSESEKIIQKALPSIIGKHTAIVIAHRLSTVAQMDRILVMHAGRIAEEGTHEELLQLGGRYYSLWQKQASSQGKRPGSAVRTGKEPLLARRAHGEAV